MSSEREWRAFPEVPAELRPLFDVWFNPRLVDLPSAQEINMAELVDNILDTHISQICKSEFPEKVEVVPHPAGFEITVVGGKHVLEYLQVVRFARDLIYPQFL